LGFNLKILAFILGLLFFINIAKHIKRKSYNPSVSILWISVSFFLISIPLLEEFYQWLAYEVIGLQDAKNIIYIVLIGFLLTYNFYLTSKVLKISDKVQILISHNGYLESKIIEMQKNKVEDET